VKELVMDQKIPCVLVFLNLNCKLVWGMPYIFATALNKSSGLLFKFLNCHLHRSRIINGLFWHCGSLDLDPKKAKYNISTVMGQM
jgi:hypothetical protein